MKIGELVQRVQNVYSSGVASDDSRLSNRLIYHKLTTVRGRLIAQESNRRKKISRWNFQTLPCVELIEAQPHECECLPKFACDILRSKHKLPKPIADYGRHLISSVTSLDGSITYQEKTSEGSKYSKGNKYTKESPSYYIRNGYLYTTYNDGPMVITIEGLFEDPVEVQNFPKYCPNGGSSDSGHSDCESMLERDFPVEADMVDAMIELTVNELVRQFNQSIEDRTNNGADAPIERSK